MIPTDLRNIADEGAQAATNAADIATRALTDDLADFIAEQRDGYPRVCDDMDSGELADAVLTFLAAHTTPDPDALRVRLAAVEALHAFQPFRLWASDCDDENHEHGDAGDIADICWDCPPSTLGYCGECHDEDGASTDWPCVTAAALGASATTTPDQQALTAAREAVTAASEVVAAARHLMRVRSAPLLEARPNEHARAWDRLAAALGSAEVES